MHLRLPLLLIAGLWSGLLSAAEPNDSTAVVQAGATRHLRSAALGEDRTVLIWVPPSYAAGQQRYPVLYKLDGHRDVFLQAVATTEYLSDWKLAPEYIVVGIENTDRRRDMLPEAGAEKFLRFLTDELVPFIDANYRTTPSRVLAGQSLSTTLAAYALLRTPAVFDGYVLSSFGLSSDGLPRFQEELRRSTVGTTRDRRVFVANARTDSFDPDGARARNGLTFLAALQQAAGPAVVVESRVFADEGHVPFPSLRQGLAWINAGATPASTSAIAAEPLPGVITQWQLSPTAQPFSIGPEVHLDGRKAAEIEWHAAAADADGWIDIGRTRAANAEGASKVWARTTITAGVAESHPYAVSCPGEVSLYLNGRPVARFDHRSEGPTARETSDTVFLPLTAGENELALMVTTEVASRWRFQVRDVNAIRQSAQLTTVWEQHDASLGAPESVAYDAKRRVLYASRFSAGAVARMSLDGRTVARDWCQGLQMPTGLTMHGDRLYAVDRSGVVAIDPESGAILGRTPIEGVVFANDLAIAADDTIYVTDTFKSCIHRIAGGRSEVWYAGPEVAQPNGILAERDRLLVGVTADSTIKAIDLATKKITTFVRISAGANMDGLVGDGGSGYLLSDYFGRLYHADAAGKLELLLDRRGPRQFIADFEYVPSERLLVIPSLYDQRLTALRWVPPDK